MRIALLEPERELWHRPMNKHETIIDLYDPVKSETFDKATPTGQEASFLIETELDKLVV